MGLFIVWPMLVVELVMLETFAARVDAVLVLLRVPQNRYLELVSGISGRKSFCQLDFEFDWRLSTAHDVVDENLRKRNSL